eukprot:m.20108 g.20108  ORF g.20108 m.20108 type:complete len:60 (-) comp6752_c0_seq1:480-659(-)
MKGGENISVGNMSYSKSTRVLRFKVSCPYSSNSFELYRLIKGPFNVDCVTLLQAETIAL